ncbi:hypothetical protein GCM10007424_23580 [Flavobacterium suaedae]|uniref:Uncharacterized protein n=1 Tax=Flavobacterium suaedae TaxID=1767027 RepID=A0ABQ1JZ00_9FLAO|nr:hypothetical protein [Flavobacterium suaedae]GGB82835.1 hypothetical protein GCM10007424_23580 [Flavobacterium suaedae]
MKKDIIGKQAIIDCLTEQLRGLGIKDMLPGKEVTIINYNGNLEQFGDCYEVSDGMFQNIGYVVPLRWLNIIE